MAAAHEEQQVQIEMIKAIVQSQSALARMLNQMADLTAHSEAATKLLKEQHIQKLQRNCSRTIFDCCPCISLHYAAWSQVFRPVFARQAQLRLHGCIRIVNSRR